MPSLNPPASVIYLARAAEGVEAVERFRLSYVAHPAGMAHELVVCLKGDDEAQLQRVREILQPIATRFVSQRDVGYDIHAYIQTARTVRSEWVCCLNTFSMIGKPRWLRLLHEAASRPGVGMVGATASFESRRATLATWIWYIDKLIEGAPLHLQTHDQFAYLLRALDDGYTLPRIARLGRRLRLWGLAEEPFRRRHLRLWREAMANDPPFPGFPNPHVRSNGFMLRPDFLVSRFGSLGPSKMDCYLFESGPESLSATVAREGLSMMVVGERGTYDIKDWPRSGTFRAGEQEALLIHDNQTETFTRMPPETREIHSYFTWGDAVVDPAGFEFPAMCSVRNGGRSADFADELVRDHPSPDPARAAAPRA
jgi:hypothetical protein